MNANKYKECQLQLQLMFIQIFQACERSDLVDSIYNGVTEYYSSVRANNLEGEENFKEILLTTRHNVSENCFTLAPTL